MTDPQQGDPLEAAAYELCAVNYPGGVSEDDALAILRRHGLRAPAPDPDREGLVERVNRLDYALRVMRNVFRPRDGEPGPDQHVEVEACNLADDALRHAARGTVARALAAPAEREGWRPIESAPDFEQVLVVEMDGGRYIAQKHGGGWYDSSDGVKVRPTHWMPLPPAPEQKGGA